MLAYETDLLEYPDIFEGSKVMDGLVAELLEGARAEMAIVDEHGGAVDAVDYMKAALVDSHRERIRRIEAGEQVVVGLNRYTETERSPLLRAAPTAASSSSTRRSRPQQREAVVALARRARPGARSTRRWPSCARVAADDGRTSWRRRSPRPARAPRRASGRRRCARRSASTARRRASARPPRGRPTPRDLEELREEVDRVSEALGRRLKILVGKPGLDGHSNGAEQIAVRARDIGMDVVYEGIRLTPSQIAASALQEGVHVVGLSILSGSHRELIPAVVRRRCARRGVEAPVVVGGIIPEADVAPLREAGVAAVYTPKDFDLTQIMRDIVALVAERHGGRSSA